MKRSLLLLLFVACGGSPAPSAKPPVDVPAIATPAVAPTSAAKADAATPLDPQIKRGTLPNGLTYYVMPHKKPEQRAALWLAVNAGSVLEDADQRGLAHFVEHMAFNGTTRFPKQAIVNYVEKIGMRFGPDVNAYTSFDETVYQLTVPTDDQKEMLTGLDILRDWAGNVTFDPVEVDKERGVVLEEWRLGRGAWARIEDKQWPIMFQGSRYAERLPIGLPEIIKGAPRDALVRFYKTWYRPQNMAVIAVGDFDGAAMLKEITARFGDLAPDPAPRAREAMPVPHEHPTAVAINTDPEMQFTTVSVYDKLDHRPEATRADYRRYLVEALYHRMLGARFSELALDPAAPFTYAGSSTSDLTRTADGFVRSATAKQGHAAEALAVLFKEIARVEAHGFLQSELERARAAMLASIESEAAEWDKTYSDALCDEITRHFFTHEQMPGRPYELAMHKELLPTITLAELDHLARSWGGDKGRVITIVGPAGTALPTEADVKKLIATTAAPDAWRDDPPHPLLAQAPQPGKVVATKQDAAAGITEWTLANGIRVVVKPTTFQNDSIEIQGFQPGGSSLISDPIHARFAADVVGSGGVGELDAVALQKALAGKVAFVDVSIAEQAESVYGSTRPADLETELQLLNAKLTQPRRDERAFAAWKADQLEWVRNRKQSPERFFRDELTAVQTGNHPRRAPTTAAMLDKVDLDKALAVWRDRFSDLGNFTFFFIGNVDAAKLQPLVETYLGSLPSKGRQETWKDVGIKYAAGKVAKSVTAGTEPKSYVQLTFSAPDKWTRDAARDADILESVLRIRLREVLREDMGGVYGVRVWAYVSREPTQRRNLTISYGCDPANVAKLRAAVFQVSRAIQQGGIGPEYLEKVTEQLKRERQTDSKENWWWAGQLHDMYWFKEDFATTTDLDATLKRVTSDNVRAAAKHFLDEKNLVEGVLVPAKK